MFRVGLTGGIASGKSEVAKCFAELGARIIDTDVISRELVAPGSEALNEITRTFGPEILTPGQSLNRAALAQRVFQDEQALTQLSTIMHPRIRDEMLRQADEANDCYTMLVVPLLVETAQYDLMQRVLLVTAPEETRMRRLARRDGMSTAEINHRIRAQVTDDTRVQHADDIIVNTGTLSDLHAKVGPLHRRYRELAGC